MRKVRFFQYAAVAPLIVAIVMAAALFAMRLFGAGSGDAADWVELLAIVTMVAAVGYAPFAVGIVWLIRRTQSDRRALQLMWVTPLAVAVVYAGAIRLGVIGERESPGTTLAIGWGLLIAVVGYLYVAVASATYVAFSRKGLMTKP